MKLQCSDLCLLTSQWFTHPQVDTRRGFFPLHPHGSSASHQAVRYHQHSLESSHHTWPENWEPWQVNMPNTLCINLTSRDPLPLIKPFELLPSPTCFSLHQYFSHFQPAAPEQFRTSPGCLPFCHMGLKNLYIPIERYSKHLKELERGCQTVLLESRPWPFSAILLCWIWQGKRKMKTGSEGPSEPEKSPTCPWRIRVPWHCGSSELVAQESWWL